MKKFPKMKKTKLIQFESFSSHAHPLTTNMCSCCSNLTQKKKKHLGGNIAGAITLYLHS